MVPVILDPAVKPRDDNVRRGMTGIVQSRGMTGIVSSRGMTARSLLVFVAAAMHLDLVIDVFFLQQLLHRVDEAP